MRVCHAAGPGSIPGRDKFPRWGFFGVFSHLYDECQEALGPQGSRTSFDHHNHPLSFHYGRQWPEMLTRPKTSNIHTYTKSEMTRHVFHHQLVKSVKFNKLSQNVESNGKQKSVHMLTATMLLLNVNQWKPSFEMSKFLIFITGFKL